MGPGKGHPVPSQSKSVRTSEHNSCRTKPGPFEGSSLVSILLAGACGVLVRETSNHKKLKGGECPGYHGTTVLVNILHSVLEHQDTRGPWAGSSDLHPDGQAGFKECSQ